MRVFEAPSTRVYRYEWEVTPEGELRRVSGSEDLLNLHGHDPGELASPEGWKRVVAPENLPIVTEIANEMRAGRPWNGRFPVQTASGHSLILEIHNEIERCDDGRLLIHGIARDVTHEEDGGGEAKAADEQVIDLRSPAKNGHPERPVLDLGDLVIDLDAREVTKAGRAVHLTPTEFELLVELGMHQNRTIERDHLLNAVWGYEFSGSSSPLWMTIKRLRDKIEDDPRDPQWIQTVRGVGYRLTTR